MIETLGKNKYRFVVNIGSGASRRRVTKTIIHSGGKKELKRLYDAFAEEATTSKPLADITVGELLESHIEFTKTLGRKQTTIRGYNICVERFDARFKGILAKDLSVYHIEKEISSMSRKKLSAKTIKNTIGLLSAAYEHAIHTMQLESNPCRHITLPKVESKHIRILYQDEIQDFLYGIADVDLNEKIAYLLALFMGLRRSEILGLKEEDIDIVNGMLYVHNTRHRVDGEDYNATTKTERSTRVLAMPEIVQLDIARLIETHRQFPYEKTDYLIQDGFGNPLGGQALASRLHRLEERKHLPFVSLHGLRHTYASLLNSQGVDMARISAELGHSNLTTTANLYTHIFKNPTQSSRGIAEVINRFVGSFPQEISENSAPNLPLSKNEKR